jgi:hypothetical protein
MCVVALGRSMVVACVSLICRLRPGAAREFIALD